MKFRLFGDLETISTICKIIMNVPLFSALSRTVCSLERFGCTDALWLKYSGHISTYVQTSTLSVNSDLLLHFKSFPSKNVFYIAHTVYSLKKQVRGHLKGKCQWETHSALIITVQREQK